MTEDMKAACPEWGDIGMSELGTKQLYRHFMFLGETGSGKTLSGIQPLCRLAFAKDGFNFRLPAAGFVVDPKGELGDFLEHQLCNNTPERVIRLKPGGAGPVLWHFEHRPISGLGGTGIIEQMLKFSDSFNGQKNMLHDTFWIESAKQLLANLIEIDLCLWQHPNGLKGENISDFWRAFFLMMHISGKPHQTHTAEPAATKKPSPESASANEINNAEEAPSIQQEILKKLTSKAIDQNFTEVLIRTLENGEEAEMASYRPDNYLEHFYELLALSTSGSFLGTFLNKPLCERHLKIKCDGEPFQLLWGVLTHFMGCWQIDGKTAFRSSQSGFFQQYTFMASGTYSSVFAVVSSLISELRMPEFTSRISLNPFEPPENQLSTRQAIADGRIVLYEPQTNTSVTANIGKVLKSAFFKALLVPERMNNPQASPFFYICDEFQRFITHDDDSGEQSLLDRCRAYNVCCGLATQSIASLRYAYTSEAGYQSIKILMINTGTKLFFRTTDDETDDSLARIMPSPSRGNKLHVVRVRPPSSLKPGECYYTLVNGKAGRGQVLLENT
jgi:hypothetical protein